MRKNNACTGRLNTRCHHGCLVMEGLFMARLGMAGLGPTCEVKVEVCGWEGKQHHHHIYQRSRGRAGFHPDPGCVKECFPSPMRHYMTPRVQPRPSTHPPRLDEAETPTQETVDPHRCPTTRSRCFINLPVLTVLQKSHPGQLGMPQPAFPLPSTRRGLQEPAWALGF